MNPNQFAAHHAHFKRFPCLTPWVGAHYQSASHQKLLIVAESHYLPKESTLHKNSARWYNDLTEADFGVSRDNKGKAHEEREWVSTAGILGNTSNRQRNFNKRGHAIHRNICKLLKDMGLTEPLPNHVCDHYAYYNFFQRPAQNQGGSVKPDPLDIEKAEEILNVVLDVLNPDLVVFTSSKAGQYGKKICIQRNTPVISVPHPACAWWNRKSGKVQQYGTEYTQLNGRQKMQRFLKYQGWIVARPSRPQ